MRRQAKQLAAGRRRAEYPAGRCDVPTARVMSRRDGAADTALDFHSQDERGQDVAAGQLVRFSERQCSSCNRRRRMNDRFRMRVVEIEQVCRDRIDERCTHGIEPLGAPNEGRGRRTAER